MTRHVLIDPVDGKVVNIIEWEGVEWTPPRNRIVMRNDTANIGDTWDEKNKKFIYLDRTAKG